MRNKCDPSRYDVNNTNVYLVNVVSGQYRPLETKMQLQAANQYVRDRGNQYTYPYKLYACNDRVRPHSEAIAEFCTWMMKFIGYA